MSNEEILQECESQYAIIKKAEERLKEIRENICQHEETFEGNYSWRIGSIEPATICKFCHKPLKFAWQLPLQAKS